MGLLSYFKRRNEPSAEPLSPAAAPVEPDAVAAARSRARRRLIGASVLLGVGVIGFPLLFETQPRPVPLNIPIEIPNKDGAAPLVLAPAAPLVATAAAQQAAALDPAPDPAANRTPPATPDRAGAEIVERATDQGRELPLAVAPVPAATPTLAAPPMPKPALAARPPAPAASRTAPPAASIAPSAKAADDGARARALLDGQASVAADAPALRVVVQVGAYADAAKLVEARHKLEALGLKTYTQVVEVDGAQRTRVRVGPFASRAEADKAAARIKAAGLPVAILTL